MPAAKHILSLAFLIMTLGCSDENVPALVSQDVGVDQTVENDTNVPVVDLGSPDAEDLPAIQPTVHFLAPSDGEVLTNPVVFRVEVTHVATVQIFADELPLADAWDPAQTDSLTHTFEVAGPHIVTLVGYDETGEEVARHQISMTIDVPLAKGTSIGTFRNTYYYLAEETAHTGDPAANLYDRSCNVVAQVSQSFANSACIEGSAKLADGRVINYAAPCSCGGPCSFCWSVMNPATHPWGMGSRGNTLEPLRSWATDKDVIAYGTVLYVEEWDGLEIPSVEGLGGITHDGCFRADDVGGGINGNHVDIFAGGRSMWRALEGIFPTRTYFEVYKDSPRCAHL
jgi:3D (Asp-Asp-Asp) domain-containing protein